jgi:hypothetical protein
MASSDFYLRQGNTSPIFTATITDSAGAVVNLTGATVTFVMRAITAAAVTVSAAATIVSAVAGTVSYTPLVADTAAAGLYLIEWQYTLSGGAKGTYPADGYQECVIEENLSTAGGARMVGLAEVKDHLRIPSTDRSHDARLMRMIDGITPVVENITGPIVQKTYTETYDGGRQFISLRHRPVISVTSVVEYRGGIAYTLTQVATPDLGTIYSYAFQTPGRIVRRTVGGGVTTFPAGPDAVAVVYVAGFATVPHNVREGALELIRVNYQYTQQGGRPAWGSAGGDGDNFSQQQTLGFFVPNRVRELLSPNKRHPSVA